MNTISEKANAAQLSLHQRGKTRITIRIDDEVLEWFRGQVDEAGGRNYQTSINNALPEYIQIQAGKGFGY